MRTPFFRSLSQLLLAGILICFSSLVSAETDHPRVMLETSQGNILLELDAKAAPITVKNFLRYVDEGFYNATIFHRVISNFMIQGGGFTTAMEKKETHEPIKNESDNGLKNVRGAIAMARTGDPHSATAQFYINVVDNPNLNIQPHNWGYAVFGKVAEGMETVDKIRKTKTTTKGMYQNVPIETIVINKAYVVQSK